MMVLVPLVLGIVQLGLVLHVRNTITAAASDGARAGAPLDVEPDRAADRARTLIRDALDDRYAEDVESSMKTDDNIDVVTVRVRTRVPALGLFGPSVPLDVEGHAVREVEVEP